MPAEIVRYSIQFRNAAIIISNLNFLAITGINYFAALHKDKLDIKNTFWVEMNRVLARTCFGAGASASGVNLSIGDGALATGAAGFDYTGPTKSVFPMSRPHVRRMA